MAKVTIIQRIIPHYRITFFKELVKRLQRDGIDLQIIYGQEYPGTVPKSVNINEEWAIGINNKYFSLANTKCVWQPAYQLIKDCDLCIMEQANRLLLNYILFYWKWKTGKRLALWGHGKNMQAPPDIYQEKLKTYYIKKADWWFAYTEITRRHLIEVGYPEAKITVVNNAIDTNELVSAAKKIPSVHLENLRKKLKIQGTHVGLYCGGMYPHKKLSFLIKACLKIRNSISDFEMLFIGSGPDQVIVENASKEHTWIKYLGPKYGIDRVPYFLISHVFLMPGLVGLAILDSFAMGLPMFTTDIPIHSPEIAYLENGENGIITSHNVLDYASAVAKYLQSKQIQNHLQLGCRISYKKYTLTKMIDNFNSGIHLSLEGLQ